MKAYLNSKLKLFRQNLKKKGNIVCNDNIKKILIKNKISKISFKYVLDNKIKYPIKIINVKKNNSKTLIKVNFKNNIYTFNINLIGQFQIENLYQSIILALSSGLKKLTKFLKF